MAECTIDINDAWFESTVAITAAVDIEGAGTASIHFKGGHCSGSGPCVVLGAGTNITFDDWRTEAGSPDVNDTSSGGNSFTNMSFTNCPTSTFLSTDVLTEAGSNILCGYALLPKGLQVGANGLKGLEGAAPSGVGAADVLYPDSTAHRWKMNNNNGGAVTVGTLPIYTANGTEMLGAPHAVQDTCTLGTNCGVTFSGSAAFTSATSYSCSCHDQTTPLNACGVNQTAGNAITITGTGTDVIRFQCSGN